MANDKMVETKNSVLRPQDFIPRFERALDLISKEFRIREKVWIHGHFKPQEIFKISNSEYYLIDFAHTHYYPEGYELAFIIWADWLISADWKLDYNEWRKGVFSWIENLRPVAKKMKIKKYDNLIRASIIERIMGTIMADIYIANKTRQEKELRIKLLYKLFDELI